jgi:hypothetical protein
MTWTATFDAATRRGLLVATGPVELASSVEAILALAADPRLESGWDVLVDLRGADYAPSLADTMKLAGLREHSAALRGRRLAMVAAAPALLAAAGLVAMISTTNGVPAKVFPVMTEAESWLSAETT